MKKSGSKLFKNTSALMLATGLQPVLNFVLVLFISRIYSKEGLGEYTTAFALYNIFQLFCAFGMKMYLARETAKHPEKTVEYLSNAMFIVTGFSVLSALGMAAAGAILQYPPEIGILVNWLAVSLIATAFIECFLGVLTGFERLGFVALITLAEELAKVGVSIICLMHGIGIISIVAAFVAFRFLSAGIIYLYIRRVLVRPVFQFDRAFCAATLKQVSYFAMSIVFMAIFWQADVIILSKMGSIEDVGLYGAAFRLFRIVFILMQSFLMALYPILSKRHHQDPQAFQVLYGRVARYLLIVLLPVSITTLFVADKLVLFIFKDDFIQSYAVFQVLIAGLYPFVLSNLLAYVLLASNHQKFDLRANIIGVILKIIFVYYLTWQAGYMGTAAGTVIAFVARLAMQGIYLKKGRLLCFDTKQTLRILFKTVIAASLMIMVIAAMKRLNVYMAVAFGAIVYGGIILRLQLISAEEKQTVVDWLRLKWRSVVAA